MVCAKTVRRLLVLVCVAVLVPAVALAAGKKPAKVVPAAETVEMFRAIEGGQISVRMIPEGLHRGHALRDEQDQAAAGRAIAGRVCRRPGARQWA